MKKFICGVGLCSALLAHTPIMAADAISGFGLERKEILRGTQHYTQYHSRHTHYEYEVPAEFGFDGNWNGTFLTTSGVFGGQLCGNYATGNQIVVNNQGAGNTTVVDSKQKVLNSEITAIFKNCKVSIKH
jgi:hypothetical protein